MSIDYRHDALPSGHLLHNNTYHIERVLGAGAFGITYLARHVLLGSHHVIKEYFPDTATRVDGMVTARSNQEEALFQSGLQSFYKEAQWLHQLSHPNVVKVSDMFENHGTAYFVMPYLGDTTLLDWINAHTVPDRADLERIFIPLLEGLKYIHEQGLLHRDIKPANILLANGHVPTLIDFGSARITVSRNSRPLEQILTPGFAPIEQYSNRGPYTPALDVYGLAACLHQAITGELPPEAPDRVQKHDPYEALVRRNPYARRYPQYWLAAIDKGLNVHASDRFQNAFDMQNALMGKAGQAQGGSWRERVKKWFSPAAAPAGGADGQNLQKARPQPQRTTPKPSKPKKSGGGCAASLLRLLLIGGAAGIGTYGYFAGKKGQTDGQGAAAVREDGKPYRGELSLTVAGKKATFSGRIENGKANDADGKLVFADGTVCEGSIVNNKREGTVSCTYPKGSRYTGTWKNDQKHGEGEYIMGANSAAQSYRGGYVRGKLQGEGVIVYKNGASYEGAFANDRIMGKGTMTGMKDAPACKGEFNQLKNTAVCSYRENGLTFRYEGGFKNALWEGKGRLIRLDGGEEVGRSEGIFKQGELVEETRRPAPPVEGEKIENDEESAN
ncbi:protein kinase [Conchiformibius kuhniae]|uniref:Protein kinase n=1 Tax=Conchiformibius kuhniae TaxID=211502 RepID=A0A8T9MT87_9NEIS